MSTTLRPSALWAIGETVRSKFSGPVSPQVRWFVALSAAAAACAALAIDPGAQASAGRPPIVFFTFGVLGCLHAIRWMSRRQNVSLIPAPLLAAIFAALYAASPLASRLASFVLNDSGEGSGAVLLSWMLGYSIAPFAASGLLELLLPKKKTAATQTVEIAIDPQTTDAREEKAPRPRRAPSTRSVALGVLTAICVVLEYVWNAARPAYFAQALWVVSVMICGVTLPDLFIDIRERARLFWDEHADPWMERLNQQVNFRGIAQRIAGGFRSFLKWKINLESIAEYFRLRLTRRRSSVSHHNFDGRPTLLSRRREGGRGVSVFSRLALQAMALAAGVAGLIIAPHGDAHGPSLYIGLWVLAAVFLLRKVGDRTRVRRWIRYGGLIALGVFPALPAIKSEIKLPDFAIGDLRAFLIGQGIRPQPSETGLEFIGEQGVITWLLIGAILFWGVYRSASILGKRGRELSDEGPGDEKRANGESAVDLFCAAAVTIILALYLGISFSNPGVMTGLAFSVGILFAVSRQSTPRTRTVKSMRWKPVAFAVATLFLVTNVGVHFYARSIAQGYTPGAPVPYVAWNELSVSARKTVLASAPFVMNWSEGHALIRRCFGAQVNTPLSAPAVVAARITGADCSTNPLRSVAAMLIGMRVSSLASESRNGELYANLQNYGYIGGAKTIEGTIGVAQAAQSIFGVPPSRLSAAQTDFLLGNAARVNNLSLIENPSRIRFLAAPSQYTYQGFSPKGLPQVGGWEMHNGVLNNNGVYASHMIANGSYPYISNTKGAIPLDAYNSGTEAWSINDAGEVAGYSAGWAALWDKFGTLHNLGSLPGFAGCAARAINNHGEIAGYAWNADAREGEHEFQNTAHAFLWSHGRMTDLGVPYGYVSSRAYAINDRGQVAGWLLTKSGQTHAMLWQDGVMHDLGTFAGGQTSVGNAINNAGQVVGSSQHQDGSVTACLWQNGRILDLGRLPGDVYSRALGINDLGQIVGESRLDSNVNYGGGTAFIWDAPHGMRDLTPMFARDLVWRKKIAHCTMATSINDRQEILGYGFYEVVRAPRTHFILTP